MIILLFLLPALTLGIGLLVLWYLKKKQQSYGSLGQEKIYIDTAAQPGKILRSSTTSLIGKPDYLVKEHNRIIPVEHKTGKTPRQPYPNHIAQLIAYCFLVEEEHGAAPPYGYIKYPEREFKVAYTTDRRENLLLLINNMMKYKAENKEFFCKHPEHNRAAS